MAKVIKKRKRIKVIPLFIFLVFLSGFIYISYLLLDMPIKNIVIKGNDILKDYEIIKQADIEDYPSFLKTTSGKIKKRLLKNDYIENVIVKKRIFNKLIIEIRENKILFINPDLKTMTLSNGKTLKKDENSIGIPFLINEITDENKEKLVKKMNIINEDVLQKVSQLKYEPTELDKGRYLFSMNDGNYVYLTLTKFKNINYYDEVLPQLEGKKGILYLDSGNHFKIMDK